MTDVAAAAATQPPALLGEILVWMGVVQPEQVRDALVAQAESGGKMLGELLVEAKACAEDDVDRALGVQGGLPYLAQVDPKTIDTDLVRPVPIGFAKGHLCIPLSRYEDGTIAVATGHPLDTLPLDDLRLLLNAPVELFVSGRETVLDAINAVYQRTQAAADAMMDDLEAAEGLDSLAHELEYEQDIIDQDAEAPIIRLVNSLIFQAAKDRATDIHIEPFERDIAVRFRIDGVLYEILRPPKRIHASMVSRVKIMSGLNIAEKRLPQDGRIRRKVAGRDIDIRVATVPTAHGEAITMRLLDKGGTLLSLDQLGVEGAHLGQLRRLIHASHGIVFVTGPTGSGKTTTLYAGLTEINKPDLKIITVEDPIEYQLSGVNQIQVNPKINLTFATGLRSILRHDPDVIMVGEIRDRETAEIAIQASLTGHLVFSTVHTNDSATTFTRLNDMGIEPFLIASSVIGCVAQRLVRVLCEKCRKPVQPTPTQLAEIGVKPEEVPGHTIYEPEGCDECSSTGYKGRTGIYELLVVDDHTRDLVTRNADASQIKRDAVSRGMRTLRDDGAVKVLAGETSIAEVLRVTQVEMIAIEEGA